MSPVIKDTLTVFSRSLFLPGHFQSNLNEPPPAVRKYRLNNEHNHWNSMCATNNTIKPSRLAVQHRIPQENKCLHFLLEPTYFYLSHQFKTWHKIELLCTFRPKMGSCRVERQRIMKTKKKDGSFLSVPVPVNFLCVYFVSPVTQSFLQVFFFFFSQYWCTSLFTWKMFWSLSRSCLKKNWHEQIWMNCQPASFT